MQEFKRGSKTGYYIAMVGVLFESGLVEWQPKPDMHQINWRYNLSEYKVSEKPPALPT